MSDYYSNQAANFSRLKILLDKTPAHLKAQQPVDSESKCLIIGRAIHCLMLEPQGTFFNQFIIAPDVDKRTKEGKQIWVDLAQSGKTILSADDADLVFDLEMALRNNDTINDLLSEGEGEKELYANIDGVDCKGKLDWYRNGIILDLKTVQDASASGFGKQVATYHYDMQASLYSELARQNGLKVNHFIFVCVEKTAPFLTATYIATPQVIENGTRKYQQALKIWKECHELNQWRGYPTGIQELELPAWAEVHYE